MKNYILPIFLCLLLSCNRDKPKLAVKPINQFYEKAWVFSDQKIPDSSFVYFNKAKEEFAKFNDSVGIAKSLINMAIISGDQGDYFGSQEISLSAIKYLNIKDSLQREILSSNYNNLAKVSQILKDYKLADEFYLNALKFTANDASKYIYNSNIAINLSDQHKYKEAIAHFENLIKKKSATKNSVEYARILSNISKTKWLLNPNYSAAPQLLIALNIREKENDNWGKNASYSHLADYYAIKKPDSALYYATEMYGVAKKIISPDDQLEALQKLIKLSPPAESKTYFETYKKLSDSVQTARNAAKNQFAVIRYESEKSKADNLKLQQENTKKQYQIIKREVILAVASLLFIGFAVIAFLWYKKRQQKMELEKQNAVKENQLKNAKKVHDVVANGLYRVMTEIENESKLNKELILDKIENLYEKSRDISYEKPSSPNKPFNEVISELLGSFATEKTKILIAGNDAELWRKVNAQNRYELEHIIQELMVNMQKHSQASNVALRFENINEQINIYYTDNGKGIPENTIFGNGLRNTGNRIEQIKGAITFDTKVQKGLKIQITFPVS